MNDYTQDEELRARALLDQATAARKAQRWELVADAMRTQTNNAKLGVLQGERCKLQATNAIRDAVRSELEAELHARPAVQVDVMSLLFGVGFLLVAVRLFMI